MSLRSLPSVLFPVLWLACAPLAPARTDNDPRAASAARFLDHVATLAADDMEGRDTGSAGNAAAAGYVARAFEELGLEPAGDGGTFFQEFQVTVGRKPLASSALRVDGQEFAFGVDFLPVEFSIDGRAEGPLVLGAADVAGKIAVVEARPEQEPEIRRRLANADAAGLVTQMEQAFAAGAKGLLVVVSSDALPEYHGRTPFQMSLPCAYVSKSAGARLAAAAQSGAAAELVLESDAVTAAAQNVVGWLPPAEEAARPRHLVIGAHVDHIGTGGDSRSRGTAGAIHNGADDNASGIAALLEIARAAAAEPPRDTGIVFIAFNGEELGLLGSNHYVKAPARPLGEALAMLNLDMVGRALRAADAKHAEPWRYLSIGGAGSAAGFDAIIRQAHEGTGTPFELDVGVGIFNGSSDHIPFYTAGVPVLFFFTGLHNEYHADTDDVDRIDAAGGADVTALAWSVARSIAGLAEKPAFLRVEEPPSAGQGPASPGRTADPNTGSAYGVYLGTIPDFAAGGDGVVLSGVQPESPAEKAGLAAGDRMIRFDGKDVKTLKDFATLLRTKQIGDVVEIVVIREGEERTVQATMGRKLR